MSRILRNISQHLCRAYPGVSYLFSRVRLYQFRLRTRNNVRRDHHSYPIDPLTILWVQSESIQYITQKRFRSVEMSGKVRDGDWDRLVEKFEDFWIYRGLRDHFVDKIPWEQTCFVQRILGEMEKKRYIYHECRNSEELDARLRMVEDLYAQIQAQGYQSKQDILENRRRDPIPGVHPMDEITVNVGRKGDFLFRDGIHRFSIAKILAIPSIPVRVVVRHEHWQQFRDDLWRYLERSHGGRTKFGLNHPDLQEIPSVYNGEALFQLLETHRIPGNGSVVDLTPDFGYLCQRFGEHGVPAVAVADDGERGKYLKRLQDIGKGSYRIADAGTAGSTAGAYTTALLLDCPAGARDGRLEKMLLGLDARELFLLTAESPVPAENGGPGGSGPAAFIASRSLFPRCERVWHFADSGETMFRFSR